MKHIDTEIVEIVKASLERMVADSHKYSRRETDMAKSIIHAIDHLRLQHELSVEKKVHGGAA
ncbi:hypothetical protein SAMN02745157_0212 [Kaistia soli DSM 19436]|uniref:Uncharacterized protein n=1 Tax=Kaistia soli DSM 19436 TaxID=1122133 RepID=A0A1M5PRC2_9HYPH|nr:hypothetical protein [Kaistia soli]SHH04049.1 hypothetical protein SAMN02745157_0212 [Kaistia soli DSM 19436]